MFKFEEVKEQLHRHVPPKSPRLQRAISTMAPTASVTLGVVIAAVSLGTLAKRLWRPRNLLRKSMLDDLQILSVQGTQSLLETPANIQLGQLSELDPMS